MFLRELRGEMESTGTFKQRKVDFVKQGIDPTPVCVLDAVPLYL